MNRYDVALIPCTAKKRPHGITPLTLYMGGPFSLMIQHAAMRAKAVVIMSAKYGLLELWKPVQYYDTYLPDLDESQRGGLRHMITQQLQEPCWKDRRRVISYLPNAYQELLDETNHGLDLRRPYVLPHLTQFKILSNELKSHSGIYRR